MEEAGRKKEAYHGVGVTWGEGSAERALYGQVAICLRNHYENPAICLCKHCRTRKKNEKKNEKERGVPCVAVGVTWGEGSAERALRRVRRPLVLGRVQQACTGSRVAAPINGSSVTGNSSS
eukprot:1107297-Rhodomonas_salina.1